MRLSIGMNGVLVAFAVMAAGGGPVALAQQPAAEPRPYYDLPYEVQTVRNLVRPGGGVAKDYEPAAGVTRYASALGGHDSFTGAWPVFKTYAQTPPEGSHGPWRGLAKVNATLRAGDRVMINSGVFTDPVQPANSGAPGAPIQYIGWLPCVYLENDVVIEGKNDILVRGLYVTKGNVRVRDSRNIRLQELTLAGGSILIENCSGVLVEDTVLYSADTAGQAIVVRASENVELKGNRVHNYREALAADAPLAGADTTVVTALTDHPGKDENRTGRDYYVIQSIGDDNAGGRTPAEAFSTVEKACQVAGPGDRVFVGTGVYGGTIRPRTSGRADARIEFLAFQPGALFAPPPGPEEKFETAFDIAADFITVEGFEFRHAAVRASKCRGVVVRNNLVFGAEIAVMGCSGFLVEENRVTRSRPLLQGPRLNGMNVGDGSSDGTVRRNVVIFHHNNGYVTGEFSSATKKVTRYASNVIVEGNIFGFNHGHGLSVYWTRNLVMRRNIFCYGGVGNPYFARNDMQDSKIYNNTWYRSDWYIQPWPDPVSLHRRNDFRNNIFVGLDPHDPNRAMSQKFFTYMPLEVAPGEREFTLDYSLYFPPEGIAVINNPDRIYPNQPPQRSFKTLKEWQEVSGNDLHSLAGDPQFVDPTMLDFRLRPTSPCVDAGDPDALAPEGGGLRVDIGAFEYVPPNAGVKVAE